MFDFNKFMSHLSADAFKDFTREELERYALKLRNQTRGGKDSFSGLMKRQEAIQREQFGFDCDDFDLTEIAAKVMITQQHLQDEITEVLTALGGEHGKSAWKHWKSDHAKCKELKLDDLTHAQHDELVGEVADVMIFAMNIAVQCGISGYALAHEIETKQDINVERQENGY